MSAKIFNINVIDELTDEYIVDFAQEDVLQKALNGERSQDEVFGIQIGNMQRRLDSHKALLEGTEFEEITAFTVKDEKNTSLGKACIEDDWSELKTSKLELETLPKGLMYVFLGTNSTYPVIVNDQLTEDEIDRLVRELRCFRKAIGDIKGISPSLCMHRIHLENEFMSSIEHQRRLNPNLKEVIKKEILKFLDAEIIYLSSDSNWISHVHVVPKKGGITVIKNDNDELIPTRTITVIKNDNDYRKLNDITIKIISLSPSLTKC